MNTLAFKQGVTFGSSVVRWWRVLEHPRLARSLVKRVILLIQGRFSKELCVSSYLFLRSVYLIGRKSGWHYCALYLKQCGVSLKLAYGGHFKPSFKQSVPVSLNGSGYPRIIPRHHRTLIMKGDERADGLVQFYLSLFSFYTIVEKPKRLSKKVFRSIVDPVENMSSVQAWCSELRSSLRVLMLRYIPDVSSLPLYQGMRWIPSGKTLPTYRTLKSVYSAGGLFSEKERYLKRLSPLMVQTWELAAFRHLVEFINARGEQWNQGALFPHYVRYAFDNNNKLFSGHSLDFFESRVGPHLPKWAEVFGPPMTGVLGQKVEGGGKRRIFAIGNWVNQRLLSPVHDWLASALRLIPMDGTFHQHRPIGFLKGSEECHSLDLSAATDRWPLLIMFEVLCTLFDRSFASSVANSALAMNIFFVPFLKRSKSEGYGEMVSDAKRWVSFTAGQPLGYRASWPLFALSHHALVWWCAEQIYPGVVFKRYAILGDDIVITDGSVAALYRQTIAKLGVEISEAKSLVSHTGALEFASRFLVKRASVDLSPITLKSVLGSHLPMNRLALSFIHPMTFKVFRRLGGKGYRSLRDRPTHLYPSPGRALSSELKDYMLWLKHKSICLSWYYGGGRFLSPDQFWFIYRFVVRSRKPKPPAPFDYDSLPNPEDQGWFLEKTQMRSVIDHFFNKSFLAWLNHHKMAEYADSSGLGDYNKTGYNHLLEDVGNLPEAIGWVLKEGVARILNSKTFALTASVRIWKWFWSLWEPVVALPSCTRVFVQTGQGWVAVSESSYWEYINGFLSFKGTWLLGLPPYGEAYDDQFFRDRRIYLKETGYYNQILHCSPRVVIVRARLRK